MTRYERWQLLLSVSTILIASYIGYRQTEIGTEQNRINRALLDLNFWPVLDVTTSGNDMFFRNVGKDSMWFYGAIAGGIAEPWSSTPILLVPGATLRDSEARIELEKIGRELVPGGNGETSAPYQVYFKAANGKYYVHTSRAILRFENGVFTMSSVTSAMFPVNEPLPNFPILGGQRVPFATPGQITRP